MVNTYSHMLRRQPHLIGKRGTLVEIHAEGQALVTRLGGRAVWEDILAGSPARASPRCSRNSGEVLGAPSEREHG